MKPAPPVTRILPFDKSVIVLMFFVRCGIRVDACLPAMQSLPKRFYATS
jgi:hypothetical protein